jgi:hypothetical protein
MFNNGNWLLRWYEKKVIKQFWLTISPLQRKKSSSLPPTHMTLEIHSYKINTVKPVLRGHRWYKEKVVF